MEIIDQKLGAPTTLTYIATVVGVIGGVGSAAGAVLAALQYAPAYALQISLSLIVVLAIISSIIYTHVGPASAVSRVSIVLALTCVCALALVGVIWIWRFPSPLPLPSTVQRYISLTTEDVTNGLPVESDSIRGFLITVIDLNGIPHNKDVEGDTTQIDLSTARSVQVRACSLVIEYHTEALRDVPQVSLPIVMKLNPRQGMGCTEDRARRR